MLNFIKYFGKYKGDFEFVINNTNSIDKILFYFKENCSSVIFEYINSRIGLDNKIRSIFVYYGAKINHIGYDKKSERYKFYISLYHDSFKDSLNVIKKCKDILGIREDYFLEKDFYKLDCIGFDISINGLQMKIYELVEKNNNLGLSRDYINVNNVKEVGYLKSFTGRKKFFYRFDKYEALDEFESNFSLHEIEDFAKKIKDYYLVKKKVKYCCIEGAKKEIYFI